jgi:hypothetical protein
MKPCIDLMASVLPLQTPVGLLWMRRQEPIGGEGEDQNKRRLEE